MNVTNEPFSTCPKSSSPVLTASASGSLKSAKRPRDDNYRKIRERNNMAVKKSRAKAKQRQVTAERQVTILQKENGELKKKVDSLSRELATLKSVLTSVVASSPDLVKVVKSMDSMSKPTSEQS